MVKLLFSFLFGTYSNPQQEELSRQLRIAHRDHEIACKRLDALTRRVLSETDTSPIRQFKQQLG